MSSLRTFLLIAGVLGAQSVMAQRTAVFTDPYRPFKEGEDLMHHGLFLEAQRQLGLFLSQPRAIQEHVSQIQRDRAGLLASQSAIRGGDPQGERRILEFARSSAPDPMGNQALLEAAHYYFNAREYQQAVHFYDMVNTAGLGESARTEMYFKRGYGHFVQKNFSRARQDFALIRDGRHDYYHAANYYYGMTLFFDGKYDDALTAFRRVEEAPRYAPYIPFIISQILFAQEQYDELIRYATPKVEGRIENRTEIENLIGRAWYEKGEYEAALPHLTYAAERNTSMQATDFYQLGYCQYKAGQYEKAISNLEPLSRQDDPMGQHALFIMGDAYLKSGQKVAARNAFMQASRQTHSGELADNALFQYAKLSYELRADREAVQAFASIPVTSPNYHEAQKLLGEVLIRTSDTDFAVGYLEKADLKSAQLKEAYQKVHYAKAVQLVGQGGQAEAIPHLRKSLSAAVDPATQAMATFLLGDVYHQQRKYEESQAEMSRFFTLARTRMDLPEEASFPMANYIQGYNLLKTGKHAQAIGYFQDAVAGIKRDAHRIHQGVIRNQVLGDAILRAGDCHFKANRYGDALSFYNDAIQHQYTGFHYARFQKALILGLQGKPYDKMVELEQLVSDFPRSDYADDALYEIGKTSLDLGRLNEAAKPLRQLLDRYGSHSNLANAARLKLGLISYNQGDIQEAIRYYKQVLDNNPEPDERLSALTALEEIYVRDLSSPDDYVDILEKSGQNLTDATRDSLNFKAADNHFQSGQYEKAIAAYSQYLERFPHGMHVLQAYYRRAECHSIRKDFDAALPDYEEVIRRGPSRYYQEALQKAALIAYNHALQYAAAFRYFQMLEEAATNEQIRFEAQAGALQSAYRMGGREEEVLQYAEKVYRSPQTQPVYQGQARFYKGKVHHDRKEFDLARPAFEEVLRLLDNEMAGEAHYLIADIYFKQRNFAESRQWCLKSNQNIPGQDYWVAKCILLLSDIFVEEADLFNARAALEGLLENYHGDAGIRKTAEEKLEHIRILEEKTRRIVPSGSQGLLDMQED